MKNAAEKIAKQLFDAMNSRESIEPPSASDSAMTVDDAYAVSTHFLDLRLAAGERLVGRKIGLTSEAVQNQLGVNEPDFGNLTDAMAYPNGSNMPISQRLMQPKAEGEIAFVLREDLCGEDITESDVLAATDYVVPCFEIVDSRISDWRITLVDTVCDNASCGLFLLGDDKADPRDLDLGACEMVVKADGMEVARGTGAAALGSPLTCIAWLANTMGRYGNSLKAGDILLSGSLVPFLPAKAGTEMQVSISGIGEARVRFT